MDTSMNLTSQSESEVIGVRSTSSPVVDPHLLNAHMTYVEQWGSVLATNTVLKIAVLCLSLLCAGSLWFVREATQAVAKQRPVVVRVDKTGAYEAVNYPVQQFVPQEPEQKYFLREFVRKHFARMRSTVNRQYGESLYFLSPELRKRAMEVELGLQGNIAKFLESQAPEVDIEFKDQDVAVALIEARTAPYTATVDFERVFYTAHTRQEIKREPWRATFNYTVLAEVPSNLIPFNPLGLVITYYRTDGSLQ